MPSDVRAEDLYIEMQVSYKHGRGPRSAQQHVSRIWLRKDVIVLEDPLEGKRIIRFDHGVVWHLSVDRKHIKATSFVALRAERLRRAKYQRHDNGADEYTVRTIGEPAEVAGYPCTGYALRRGGSVVMWIWACEALDPEIEFHRSHEVSRNGDESLARAVKHIKGVWLKWRSEIRDGERLIEHTTLAIKVIRGPVDDQIFQPPSRTAQPEPARLPVRVHAPAQSERSRLAQVLLLSGLLIAGVTLIGSSVRRRSK